MEAAWGGEWSCTYHLVEQRAAGPGLIRDEFFPILAPIGTPAPVMAALGAAFRGAIQQSAVKLNELAGVTPRARFETSEQVMALVCEGVERYTAILRAAGVKPD